MKEWITFVYPNNQLLTTVLVYPTEDDFPHSLDDNGICHCKPKVEHGENGKVIIHQAFDGRQIVERKFWQEV